LNNDDARLERPILLLKIPLGMQKIFPKFIDNLDTRSLEGSPALTSDKQPVVANHFTASDVSAHRLTVSSLKHSGIYSYLPQ
jgi:hypothetical protein